MSVAQVFAGNSIITSPLKSLPAPTCAPNEFGWLPDVVPVPKLLSVVEKETPSNVRDVPRLGLRIGNVSKLIVDEPAMMVISSVVISSSENSDPGGSAKTFCVVSIVIALSINVASMIVESIVLVIGKSTKL